MLGSPLKWRAFTRFIIAVLITTHAEAGTIDDCIANFTDQIEILKTSSDIVNAVETSDSRAIQMLGISLRLGLKFAEDGVARKHKATFEWEMGQILVDARELIAFQRSGATETQLLDFVELYEQQIREKMNTYQHQALAVELIPNKPKMAGAEYYAVDGTSLPKVPIFIAAKLESFEKWLGSLGTVGAKSVKNRLRLVAETGNTGNVSTLSHDNNKSQAAILELKFSQGLGPRVYFLKNNESIVILSFGIKDHNNNGQNFDIQRASKIAEAFLAAQP